MAIDPIEKKPLNHFFPGSKVLSFGTIGCNLGCQYCQNWDIAKVKKTERLVEEASPAAIASLALQMECKSVAFTYNDPVIFMEYSIDTAKECHARGIKTVAVTAGYINPKARAEFYHYMDAANVDLKGFTDEFYKRNCAAHLAPVLDTLKYIKHSTKCWLEITTLLIPGENDSKEEIQKMCEWILKELGSDVPLHLSAFRPSYKMMDTPPTPSKKLIEARTIAQEVGLHYVYTGNISDPKGQSTYCPHCQKEVIHRDVYRVSDINITRDNLCGFCGEIICGVWR
jgi:pyruvate formate lyase activating enzyme